MFQVWERADAVNTRVLPKINEYDFTFEFIGERGLFFTEPDRITGKIRRMGTRGQLCMRLA